MTHFDVRIPGLKMTVVAVDGQNVHPVTIDEFRIAVAETFDVIVNRTARMRLRSSRRISAAPAMSAARWRSAKACARRCRRSTRDRS